MTPTLIDWIKRSPSPPTLSVSSLLPLFPPPPDTVTRRGRTGVAMASPNGAADAGVFAVSPPARELLTAARAEELVLAPARAAVAAAAAAGTPIHTARLGGLSFGADAAPVGAAALSALAAAGTLSSVDVADTIAARPEAEALAALAVLVAPLAGLESLRVLDVSDNALGAKGIRSLRAALAGTAGRLTSVAFQNNGLAADAGARFH